MIWQHLEMRATVNRRATSSARVQYLSSGVSRQLTVDQGRTIPYTAARASAIGSEPSGADYLCAFLVISSAAHLKTTRDISMPTAVHT
eukprot:scaffold185326_cov33-Tisochrysis_lutea.AAC.6